MPIQWLRLKVLVLFVNILAGCSSVSIKSNPQDADVLLLMPGQRDYKPLGKTPFEGKISDFESAVNSGSIVVQIRKDGFDPQNFYVPNVGAMRFEIDTNLKPVSPKNYVDVNRIIKLTLEAERQIVRRQFDDALKTAQSIKAINDNITSAWEIEGAVYFLKGDMAKSIVAWRRSLEIDPDNPDTAKMIKEVQDKIGGKTAAAEVKP